MKNTISILFNKVIRLTLILCCLLSFTFCKNNKKKEKIVESVKHGIELPAPKAKTISETNNEDVSIEEEDTQEHYNDDFQEENEYDENIEIIPLKASILQGDNMYPISNKSFLELDCAPFEIKWRMRKSSEDRTEGVQIASFLNKEDLSCIKEGMHINNIPYYIPGSGLAEKPDSEYYAMYLASDVCHYIYYKNQSERRAELIGQHEDLVYLKWSVDKFHYNFLDDYLVSDGYVKNLHLVFFYDQNHNKRLDKGEYNTATIRFKNAINHRSIITEEAVFLENIKQYIRNKDWDNFLKHCNSIKKSNSGNELPYEFIYNILNIYSKDEKTNFEIINNITSVNFTDIEYQEDYTVINGSIEIENKTYEIHFYLVDLPDGNKGISGPHG